jgi:hypothetical protein
MSQRHSQASSRRDQGVVLVLVPPLQGTGSQMSVGTAVETQAAILRIYDGRHGELKLEALVGLLTDLRNLHDACAWLAQPDQVRMLNTGGFLVKHYIPKLVIRDIRLGSLWLEILQAAGAPAGVGAAIWLMARVLRKGPGKLYKWAGLLPSAQTEWVRQRTNLAEERARLGQVKGYLEQQNEAITRAHGSYINIVETMPELEVSVIDEDGRELPEPPSIFVDEVEGMGTE